MRVHRFSSVEEELKAVVNEHQSICIAFSGGKDSTALCFSVLNTLTENKLKLPSVWIVHVDTLVNPPPLNESALKTIALFKRLFKEAGLNLETAVLKPALKDRFWVLVIGKGYPPPSFKFRWCTERLKLRPMRHFLKEFKLKVGYYPLVLSGVRLQETSNRKRNLLKRIYRGYFMKYERLKGCLAYAPLLKLKGSDIWEYLEYNERKWGVSLHHLKRLYSRLTKGNSNLRTGCWTCTVVKRDYSLERLAEADPGLSSMLELRNYLVSLRNNALFRQAVKRKGKIYKGPLKMEVRKDILSRLEKQFEIPSEEKELIRKLWQEEFKQSSKGELPEQQRLPLFCFQLQKASKQTSQV